MPEEPHHEGSVEGKFPTALLLPARWPEQQERDAKMSIVPVLIGDVSREGIMNLCFGCSDMRAEECRSSLAK